VITIQAVHGIGGFNRSSLSVLHQKYRAMVETTNSCLIDSMSINLDGAVDCLHKSEGRKQTNGAGQEEEQDGHQQHIPKVEDC